MERILSSITIYILRVQIVPEVEESFSIVVQKMLNPNLECIGLLCIIIRKLIFFDRGFKIGREEDGVNFQLLTNHVMDC